VLQEKGQVVVGKRKMRGQDYNMPCLAIKLMLVIKIMDVIDQHTFKFTLVAIEVHHSLTV
jgi:hypothetical protein